MPLPTSRPPPVGVTGDAAPGGLEYRERQHAILARFGALALKSTDVGALLQQATEFCAEGLRVPLCKALERMPGDEYLLVRAGVGWRSGVVGKALVGADI